MILTAHVRSVGAPPNERMIAGETSPPVPVITTQVWREALNADPTNLTINDRKSNSHCDADVGSI